MFLDVTGKCFIQKCAWCTSNGILRGHANIVSSCISALLGDIGGIGFLLFFALLKRRTCCCSTIYSGHAACNRCNFSQTLDSTDLASCDCRGHLAVTVCARYYIGRTECWLICERGPPSLLVPSVTVMLPAWAPPARLDRHPEARDRATGSD